MAFQEGVVKAVCLGYLLPTQLSEESGSVVDSKWFGFHDMSEAR